LIVGANAHQSIGGRARIEASVSLNFPPKSLDTLPDAVTSTMEAAHGLR